MPPTPPILLQLRAREILRPKDGEPRQIVEVVSAGKVLGQLPVTQAVYEMLPQDLGKLTVTVIVEHAEIRGHE